MTSRLYTLLLGLSLAGFLLAVGCAGPGPGKQKKEQISDPDKTTINGASDGKEGAGDKGADSDAEPQMGGDLKLDLSGDEGRKFKTKPKSADEGVAVEAAGRGELEPEGALAPSAVGVVVCAHAGSHSRSAFSVRGPHGRAARIRP